MKQYLQLLKDIKEKGIKKPAARANMPGSTSLFGYQFRHNLSDGFPILTTKKVYWKGVVTELMWFLRGDTNIKYLVDNGVNIWNEDAYNYYKKVAASCHTLLPFDTFIEYIKKGGNYITDHTPYTNSNYVLGDCGFQYGKVWRKWETQKEESYHDGDTYSSGEYKWKTRYKQVDQIYNLIQSLVKTPESRRHIVTAIDPVHDNDLALYWCFTENNFIKTIDGYKKINLVKNGDIVLTKEGTFKDVYDFTETNFEGTLIGIKSTSTTEIIECTPNHEFFVKNKGWVQAMFLKEDDYIGIPIIKEEKIPIIEIEYNVNQYKTIKEEYELNNKDLWWVMGYFVGDGWRGKNDNCINFSIADKEKEIIVNKLKKVFPSIYNSPNDKQKNCKTWTVSDKRLSKVFDQFGRIAKNKKVPIWVLKAPKEFIVEFLNGYKQADGYKKNDLFNVGTVSEHLIYDIQLLLAKIGISSTITKVKKRAYTKIQGRTVRQNENYYSIIENKQINQNIIIDEEFIWRRIEQILYFPNIKCKVYNFSVKDSHTYTVNNLIVHNCHAMFQFNCRPLSFKERYDLYFNSGMRYFHPHYDDETTPKSEEEWIALMDEPKINVPKYYLDCQLYQRSADVVLGVPFNIASYSLLTHILCELCNMIPGEYIHTFGDVHIYDNHLEAVEEQLKREPTKLPELIINTEFWNPENVMYENITELDSNRLNILFNIIQIDDFWFEDYNPQPAIKAELSTGLKK